MENNHNLINFIDDFCFSDELEVFDDAKDFYNIEFFSKKFNVKLESIISAWLDNHINLYVNLRSEYCRMNRYANKKEIRYDRFNISIGRDFYQHESSPQAAIRNFIPCKYSEMKEHMNFSGSSAYKYVYNGYASGYWRLQPTNITRFARGNYNLKNANNEWISIPSEVEIYGRDRKDYLLFNQDIFISHTDLFVDGYSYQKFIQLFLPTKVTSKEVDSYYLQSLIVVLLINKHYQKNNKELKALSAAESLNVDRMCNCKHIKAVSRSSIDRWIKDVFNPGNKLTIPVKNGRCTQEKDNVIYIIAKAYYWADNINITFELLSGSLLEECGKYTLEEEVTLSIIIKHLKDITLFSAQ